MDKNKISIEPNKLIKSFIEISESLLDDDLGTTLQRIADSAVEVLNADLVTILRFEETLNGKLGDYTLSGELKGQSYEPDKNTPLNNIYIIKTLNKDGSIWFETLDELSTLFLEEKSLTGIPQLTKSFWEREQVNSLAAISLRIQNKLLGAIFFNYRSEKKFDSESRLLIEAFAKYSSNAISNADILRSNKILVKNNIQLSKPFFEGMLLSGLLHNSNNILQALLLKFSRFSQRLEYATNPRNAFHQTLEFIDDMKEPLHELSVDFKKMEEYWKNESKSERVAVSIDDLVRESLMLVDSRLSQRRIKVTTKLESYLSVQCDSNEIKNVIANLLINAAQAIGKKGNIHIHTKDTRDKDVTIRITDDGKGIGSEISDKIFLPHYTTKAQGTGLGLPISKYIVEEHGGRLTFSSNEKGTTFEITLPTEEKLKKSRSKQELEGKHFSKSNLLLVEDNKYIREELSELLSERYDIELLSPTSFKELSSILESKKIESALVDVNLNAWDLSEGQEYNAIRNGIDLVKLLRDQNPSAKLAIYSSYLGSQSIKDELEQLDNVEVISKSFNIDDSDLLTPFKTFLEK